MTLDYSDQLIEQAKNLLKTDPKHPRQANLRRAVSAAYYALFHKIIDQAMLGIMPQKRAKGPIGTRIRRTVSHAQVLNAAKVFLGKQLPPHLAGMRASGGLSLAGIDPNLLLVCRAFVDLQPARHRADYNLHSPFSRLDTRRLVVDAEAAVAAARKVTPHRDGLIFLLACVFGEALRKNT